MKHETILRYLTMTELKPKVVYLILNGCPSHTVQELCLKKNQYPLRTIQWNVDIGYCTDTPVAGSSGNVVRNQSHHQKKCQTDNRSTASFHSLAIEMNHCSIVLPL